MTECGEGTNLVRFLLRILDRLEETLIATLIGAATVVIFVAVAHRYTTDFVVSYRNLPGAMAAYKFLAGIHLSWAQELCIYMFVWMAKFGAAYGVRTGIHVGVDVLVLQLPPKWRKGTILFGLCAARLFTGIIGTMGASFVHGPVPDRPDIARSRTAELDRLSLHSAWLLSDVLPLSAGRLAAISVSTICRIMITHPCEGHVEGRHGGLGPTPTRAPHDDHAVHFRAAHRADAHRHADLDRARPDGARPSVLPDRRSRSRRWR